MDKEIAFLGERVIEDRQLIAQLIHEETVKGIDENDLKEYEDFLKAVTTRRTEFIELLGRSLQQYLDKETVFSNISAWGQKTGNYFLDQGMTLDSALVETSLYRKHIGKIMKTEAVHNGIPIEVLFEVMEYFHSLLDHAVAAYSHAYIHSYQGNLEVARQEFLKLSAPVVPIYDQIAILPLVGAIDLDRAQYILEKTLLDAAHLKVSTLILDLSGVVRVDAMVAEQIIKVTQSLKLIGVETVLTGIRPEIAQTMTQLGIDIGQLMLGGSLKQAVKKIIKI